MVSEADVYRAEAAQEMARELADSFSAWNSTTLGTRERACQKVVLKTEEYVKYMDSCSANGGCNEVVSGFYTPAALWATRRLSGLLCSLDDIEAKITDLYSLSKNTSDLKVKEDIKSDLATLTELKKKYFELFAADIKFKNVKLGDKKHLGATTKTYQHVAPKAVHTEVEEVSA
ncbi:hypothetical protein BEWA_021010 [Theileria equi strain WA]|uniref:Uncharacterized protein n=1 Tax=Theileria equi strain WA TaxID=1537102 RepID=L0AWG7_THEEQ|nr:hypothetical protein BEWA_021010 [Theileria equi strain WA]AFZ79254.1 hypothetical protein BEWA_021010 [Theileria equi strain WA]|eukprot:XP_004828920.1 hypothetical protein BEWA_021010 [Theileria equi strain WA]